MVPGTTAHTSLAAVTEGGDYTGTTVSYGGVVAHHSMVAFGSGMGATTIGAYVVLEVSHDGTHWAQVANIDYVHDSVYNSTTVLAPAPYARARITAWAHAAAGATVTATIAGA